MSATNNRKITVIDGNTHRYFKTIVNGIESRHTKCAFNLERDCSPDCTACSGNPVSRIVTCNRRGLDNSFDIGELI